MAKKPIVLKEPQNIKLPDNPPMYLKQWRRYEPGTTAVVLGNPDSENMHAVKFDDGLIALVAGSAFEFRT